MSNQLNDVYTNQKKKRLTSTEQTNPMASDAANNDDGTVELARPGRDGQTPRQRQLGFWFFLRRWVMVAEAAGNGTRLVSLSMIQKELTISISTKRTTASSRTIMSLHTGHDRRTLATLDVLKCGDDVFLINLSSPTSTTSTLAISQDPRYRESPFPGHRRLRSSYA